MESNEQRLPRIGAELEVKVFDYNAGGWLVSLEAGEQAFLPRSGLDPALEADPPSRLVGSSLRVTVVERNVERGRLIVSQRTSGRPSPAGRLPVRPQPRDDPRRSPTWPTQDLLSVDADRALRHARDAARSLRHGYVGTEHLLLGLIRTASSDAADLLIAAGLQEDTALALVKRIIGRGDADPPLAEISPTPRAGVLLRRAIEQARTQDRSAADTLDLLAALLANEGIAGAVLDQADIRRDDLEVAIARRRG